MSKWLTKTKQRVSEKMAKDGDNDLKTDLGEEFTALERETDATRTAYDILVKKVPLYLHPNQTQRAKMALSGKSSAKRYRHATSDLHEHLTKSCELFAEGCIESDFGACLNCTMEAFGEISALQDQFDDTITQDMIDPAKTLMEEDMKSIADKRKKLESKRLQYDAKRIANKKKEDAGKPVADSDVIQATEKLELLTTAQAEASDAMTQMLDKQGEHVAKLQQFVRSHIEFYQASAQVLVKLAEELEARQSNPSVKDRAAAAMSGASAAAADAKANAVAGAAAGMGMMGAKLGGLKAKAEAAAPAAADAGKVAAALFDFQAENDGELSFKEGDMITNIQTIDENWLEGELNGEKGMFPNNYVELK